MPETDLIRSNIPIPDPSEITSREIAKCKAELKDDFDRSIQSLRDLFAITNESFKEILETRLDGMDTANMLLSDNVNRLPTLLDRESKRLEMLFDEKFSGTRTKFDERFDGILTKFDGIQIQFRERDIRTDQDKIAASTAVNAALQAQKEAAGAQNESNAAAITKSENSFTKEIDGLKALITTTKDAIQSDVANLTGRMDRGEGGSEGRRQYSTDTRGNIGSIVGIIGGAIGVLTLIAMMFFGIESNHVNIAAFPPEASAAQNAALERTRIINDKLDLLSRQMEEHKP